MHTHTLDTYMEIAKEKKGCEEEMRGGASMAGLKDDVEDVMKKYQRTTT